MNNAEFDPLELWAEIELEAEGRRLRHDEMVRTGEIVVMPFGQYKGRRIDLIPQDYLIYAVKKFDNMNPKLRTAIKQHLRSC